MPPTGWETESLGSTTQVWEIKDANSDPDDVDVGRFAAWVSYDMDEQSDEWLVSPPFDPGTLSDLTLTFRAYSSTEFFDEATMKVWVTDVDGDTITDFSTEPLWDMIRDETWNGFEYRTVFVDLSDFDGYASPIRIAWQYDGINGNPFGLDSVDVSADSEITWLSGDPTWGQVPAEGSIDVDLILDASGLSSGVHLATVELLPSIQIPVTLYVADVLNELYLPLIVR